MDKMAVVRAASISSRTAAGVLALAVAVVLSEDPPGEGETEEGPRQHWGYAKR